MSDNQLPDGVVEIANSISVASAQGLSPLLPATGKSVKLEDGRIITFTRPRKSLTDNLVEILANIKNPIQYESERVRVKMLMYISHINGEEIPMIFDSISRASLEEKIGDDYLDSLLVQYAQLFPARDAVILDAIKKP